jgi:hypothetical protein
MTATIQLTLQDTLPSLIVRLKGAGADRVAFVVPHGLRLTLVDLRVLRREAAGARIGLALVTRDPGVRIAAARAGISTFASARRAERARWRRMVPDGKLRARPVGPAVGVPPPPPDIYAKRSPSRFKPVSFLRAYVRRHSPWWATLGLVLILVILLGGLLAALATIIPAATVTLVPASEPIEVTVASRAMPDAKADPQAGIVPATGLSVQVAGEGRMATTGRRFEPSAKAAGRVVMSNRSARPLTVPSGTIVSTATGNNVQFATTADGKLEPNGRTELPIEAVLPGLSGNVRAGTITVVEGPLSLSTVVSNESPTGGGGSSQVAVVTEEDKQKLQSQLFEELKQKAFEKLNERLTPGMFVPAESVQYLALSPTFTPFVGDVSPDLYLSMSVQAVGLAVDTTAGNAAALDRLQRAMPPGSRLVANSVRYIPGSVALENENTVDFTVTAQGTLLRALDTGAARRAILGLTPDAAKALLAQRFALARDPDITLGPDWLPFVVPTNVPSVPWRIRTLVDWDAAAQAVAKTP